MPLRPDLKPTAHWREFEQFVRENWMNVTDREIMFARQAWNERKEIDAELVANHCPSHKLIGERMAKEILESD